ncbi:MAG: cell division protein FtsL [Caulobacteraceae bacterium]
MNPFTALFQTRYRGFRVIDLSAFICLTVLVLGVYAFKAHAGGETAKITEANVQIADEQRRIRILNADLAHLEQPARLEQLSGQYLGLAPVAAKHETTPESLMEIARQAETPTSAAKTTNKTVAAARPAVTPATGSTQ